MATIHYLTTLLLLSSLLVFALADDHEHQHGTGPVVVQGMVFCQNCAQAGSWSLTGAVPLPSAKVGVSCKDQKHRVMFYRAFQADVGGYFYAELQGLDLGSYHMDDPAKACKVHLISSPDPKCNLLTNTNAGINGARLRYEKKLYVNTTYEADLYSSGPLAFRPASCPLGGH